MMAQGADYRSTARRATVAHRRGVALLAGILAGVASCSPARDSRRAVTPPSAAPVVNVTMRDHRFEYGPAIPAGRVVFRIRNGGGVPHHLTMFPLPDDVASIQEQLRGTERRAVAPFAGIYDRTPGDVGSFAADLAPGRRYAMICSVRGDDGEPHWAKGMASQFETPAAAGAGS